MELDNTTVLVTGATGSLGPHVTDHLTDAGANIVGTYRDAAEKTDAQDRGEYTEDVSYHQVDLTDQEAVTAFADRVATQHDPIDHLVGLAGGFSMGGIDDTDADQFTAAFDRHATTAFLPVTAFADDLGEESSVVLFSSDRAINPTAGTLAYTVGKGAVRTLTETLARELDARVNAIAPYIIDVPANRDAMPDADFAEWTAPDAVGTGVVHLLTNEGIDGDIVRMTGGRPEA